MFYNFTKILGQNIKTKLSGAKWIYNELKFWNAKVDLWKIEYSLIDRSTLVVEFKICLNSILNLKDVGSGMGGSGKQLQSWSGAVAAAEDENEKWIILDLISIELEPNKEVWPVLTADFQTRMSTLLYGGHFPTNFS